MRHEELWEDLWQLMGVFKMILLLVCAVYISHIVCVTAFLCHTHRVDAYSSPLQRCSRTPRLTLRALHFVRCTRSTCLWCVNSALMLLLPMCRQGTGLLCQACSVASFFFACTL